VNPIWARRTPPGGSCGRHLWASSQLTASTSPMPLKRPASAARLAGQPRNRHLAAAVTGVGMLPAHRLAMYWRQAFSDAELMLEAERVNRCGRDRPLRERHHPAGGWARLCTPSTVDRRPFLWIAHFCLMYDRTGRQVFDRLQRLEQGRHQPRKAPGQVITPARSSTGGALPSRVLLGCRLSGICHEHNGACWLTGEG
jgi:hypothetical protein